MAKIYISSTYADLKKEREAAAKAVQRLEHQTIAMENYVASDRRPVDKCLEDVKRCDAYIGIFAWRYGVIPKGYDKSITHLEYETAKQAGIPCLIFLLDKDTLWPPKYMPNGEERQKILQLRDVLEQDHVVSFFKNADELSGLVSAAVSHLILISGRSSIKFIKPEELVGARLGKYVILEKLGRGGKGVVFKVMDQLEEREKAVKMVPHRVAYSPVAFKALKKEINTAACIIHPHVVKVLGLEEFQGQFFIVMEYIEGQSLEQILADGKEGKLEESQVIAIMKKMAQGLLETHKKNVIHRDIKPANVMLTPDGQVKILDFGISYQVTTAMTELVGEHHRTGTWPYMAPEQLSTRYGRENKQLDIWGFGVTMYQLLTGKFPFANKDQIKDKNEKPYEMEGVSRKTRNLVMKCLEKDRKKRFQSMEEVLKALNAVSTAKVKTKIKVKKPPPMKWMLMAASVILLVVLSVFLFDKFIQKDKPPVPARNGVKTGVPANTKIDNKRKIDDTEEKIEEEFKKYMDQAEKHLYEGDIASAREKLESAKKIEETVETQRLEKKIKDAVIKQKEYEKYYAAAKNYYNKGEYEKALENISKAEAIKNTGPLKKLKSNIQAKIEEKKQIELKKRDDLAYEKASDRNTIADYQAFLDRYLIKGSHITEARNKITDLEKMPVDVRKVAALASKGIKVYKNNKDFWEADYGDGIKMVYIEPGEFKMGQTPEEKKWIKQFGEKLYNDYYKDETPLHTVYLDGYWMGKTEVTVKQFGLFVKDTGYITGAEKSGGAYTWTGEKWEQKEGIYWKNPGFKQQNNHPVVCISWNDVVEYCKWLSKKKGLNFTLPTEAQWEKSARGTDQRKYPWRNHDIYYKGKWYANYVAHDSWEKRGEDGFEFTSPVGFYPQGASPYGLLDMAGNVWEWCNDCYGPYDAGYQKNPTGPESGPGRVIRGGSWNGDDVGQRCSRRLGVRPSDRSGVTGFRLCQDNK